MNKNRFLFLGTSLFTVLLITSCSNIKSSLGLTKESPDEFAVITRAPLEMPGQLSLPTPTPGAPRPQEQPVLQKAEQAVFGETKKAAQEASASENALLQAAKADASNPNIRAEVNKETEELSERNRTVVQKLLKLDDTATRSSATVVDAKKEHERIQENIKKGKDVTEGDTPYIEQ